jgi:hypothetical protein
MTREFAPAVGRNFAIFGIKPDDNLSRKSAAGIVQKARTFYSGRADDDVREPAIEIALNWFELSWLNQVSVDVVIDSMRLTVGLEIEQL